MEGDHAEAHELVDVQVREDDRENSVGEDAFVVLAVWSGDDPWALGSNGGVRWGDFMAKF